MPSLKALQSAVINQPDSPLGPSSIDVNHGTNPGLQDVTVTYLRVIVVFTWALGIIAFLAIVYGGFLYLTAGAEAEKAERGKKVLVGAIIGMIIIFVSYAAYNTFIKTMTRTDQATMGDPLRIDDNMDANDQIINAIP